MDPDDKPVNLPKVEDGAPFAGNSAANSQPPQAQNLPSDDSQSSSNSALITNIPVPEEAADSDLIEKEWVERAKQIVEHTKDDPYEQQRAIIQMKADYMKKRYNKDTNSAAD
ncbi:hypothetical protein KY385_03125 [Candidatus Parcubacteria bacterium]|nr:hypothetical protein [Candidatus Parcubacteria bacterium]